MLAIVIMRHVMKMQLWEQGMQETMITRRQYSSHLATVFPIRILRGQTILLQKRIIPTKSVLL